jgi:hypothetical protein
VSCRTLVPKWEASPWLAFSFLALLIAACGGWWVWQSDRYFRDFQLGFNDFGHFTQRISNTASGRGFLLESPVLPPFWDHFNPGLVLLVPLWKCFPNVEMIFIIQAVCLSGSAGLVAAIAWQRGQSTFTAVCWGMAWLVFPAVGQMNLAYTYGWHPITLAIPCLLSAYLAFMSKRSWVAIPWMVLAASFEEGVLIVIACYACAEGIRSWWERDRNPRLTPTAWAIVAGTAAIAFACVYQFSGLAPFQTGRFARLGDNAFEIVLSPLMRPQEFWGLLLRPRNLAFACLLLGPFVVVSRGKRLGVWWSVIPPLLVLMVWEHMPAQSLAFQYTSCLIPILFVDAIGSRIGTGGPQRRRAFSSLRIVGSGMGSIHICGADALEQRFAFGCPRSDVWNSTAMEPIAFKGRCCSHRHMGQSIAHAERQLGIEAVSGVGSNASLSHRPDCGTLCWSGRLGNGRAVLATIRCTPEIGTRANQPDSSLRCDICSISRNRFSSLPRRLNAFSMKRKIMAG